MLISKLGEFGLIKRIAKTIHNDSSVIKGPGDDCAVLEFSKGKYQLFTSDMLVEGIDFTRSANLKLVGRKALAVSISDIAACGGVPRYATVALGIAKNTAVEDIDKINQGLRGLAREYKINIVGGDISRAPCLAITVSMLGWVEKKNLVLRSGAKPGDIIFTSGALGGSRRGKHLKFLPQVLAARYLVENFKINSMTDISDGLALDLSHILEASNAGAIIYAGLIPKARQARDLADALYSGEDFELLFTLSLKQARKLLLKKTKFAFRPIGKIVSRNCGLRLIDNRGRETNIAAGGFRHF